MQIVPDEIIKSRRRTVALEIQADGKLVVRAPHRVSMKCIENFIEKKRKWIVSRQKEMRDKYQKVAPKKFIEGERFWYLGDLYELEFVDEGKEPLVLGDKFKLSKEYLPYARDVFVWWYKTKAYQIILERVELYSSIVAVQYERVRITSAKRRWGSCSSRKNLNFTWRLVLTPLEIVDYIVVHELMHIKESNHGKKFWNRVESVMPDYRIRDKWLKDNAHLMDI